MIFKERYNTKGHQSHKDGEHLIKYAAKQTDKDLKKLVKYTSANTDDKIKALKELNAPIATYIDSQFISSIPDQASECASFCDFTDAIEELKQAYLKNTNTRTPFRHFIVSLAENETLKDSQWRIVANELLTELGYQNSAFIAFKHSDTDNEHIHIVLSTVDQLTCKIVNDFQSHTRAQTVMRRMEEKFGLTHVESSIDKKYGDGTITDANRSKMKAMIRRKIDEVINGNSPNLSLDEFINALKNNGVDVHLAQSRNNDKSFKGISYSIGNYKFAGSSLKGHNHYSLGGLIKNKVLHENAKIISNFIDINEADKQFLDSEQDINIKAAINKFLYNEIDKKRERIIFNSNAKSIYEQKASADAYKALEEFNSNRYELMRLSFFANNMKNAAALSEKIRAKLEAKKLKNLLECKMYLETRAAMTQEMNNLSSILAQILLSILESDNKNYRIEFIDQVSLIESNDKINNNYNNKKA